MRPIFFTTESQSPAASIISDCFLAIKKNMQVDTLQKYTDCLDDIAIIPFCVDDEFMQIYQIKERKYIGWKRRDADIRLRMDFDTFVQATKEERMQQCKEVIIRSLEVIAKKCEAKKLRFDIANLIQDIFPDEKARKQ
jgi:hypothetical protein